MRKRKTEESWVIYESTMKGQPAGVQFVCEQSEWDAFEAAQPGARTLVQAGIKNEGQAEQQARQAHPVPAPATRIKPPVVVKNDELEPAVVVEDDELEPASTL